MNKYKRNYTLLIIYLQFFSSFFFFISTKINNNIFKYLKKFYILILPFVFIIDKFMIIIFD